MMNNKILHGHCYDKSISRKVKSKYKKVYKIAKDDPELQSALADLEGYHERLNKILKTLCKRNPDHPKCS